MRTRWAMRGVVGVLGWTLAAVGVAEADILPVATPSIALGSFPYTVKSTSPVTLVIRQGGVDKPGWLPEPGVPVQIVVKVNGNEQTSGFSITLVPPATGVTFDGINNPFLKAGTLTTSAYLGQCENADNPAPMAQDAPDYTLSGNTLTPTDCGGFAVLDVVVNAQSALPFRFIVPQDGDPSYPATDGRNANGIPAIWEATFCPSTFPCPTGREDTDARTVTSTHFGDGIPAHGEYRGFMVRGVHIRTDPRQPDLFVFQVNPQCNAGGNGPPTVADKTLSVLGGGTVTLPTGDDAFAGVTQLFGAAQTHLLHMPGASNYTSTDWVDHFVKYTLSTGLVLNPTGSTIDRQMNKNAVLRAGVAPNFVIPKGIRVIECIAGPNPAPNYGANGLANAGFVDDTTGYAIVFPQRIIFRVNCLIAGGVFMGVDCSAVSGGGGGRQLQHATYVAGRKTTPVLTGDGIPTNPANVNIWARLYLTYVITQEVFHVGDLVSPGGGHTPEQTGYFTDTTIYNKLDTKTTGFNTTYFPSGPDAVSGSDKANLLFFP